MRHGGKDVWRDDRIPADRGAPRSHTAGVFPVRPGPPGASPVSVQRGTFFIFSLVVVVIAALNLVLDFDFIEHGVAHGAPKFMEWYAAFGLMVTLVWLYLEILRLLSKLQSRR